MPWNKAIPPLQTGPSTEPWKPLSEHTPTPWRVNGSAVWAADGYVAELSSPRGADQRDVDAAFIVKAVNSHDALMKALELIVDVDTVVSDGGKVHDHGPCAAIAIDVMRAHVEDVGK